MDAQSQRTLVVFALAAALGILSVQVVEIMLFLEAEAKGCINPNAPGGGSIAVNASKGRCVQ